MGSNFEDDRRDLALTFEESLIAGSHKYFDTHEFLEIIDFFLDYNENLKAEKALNASLQQHPYSLEIQLKKADWLYETNYYDESEELVDMILEIDGNNPEANELKGDLLIHKGEEEAGIVQLQKSLEYAEEKSELLSKIGIELMQMNKVDVALQFFLRVLDTDFSDESALYNTTYCYELLNEPDKAISFLNKYIDLNPYSQIAWHQLGLQYVILKDYRKAINAFDYAIIVDDAFLGAYYEKAKCSEEIEDYSKAIEIYKHVQKIADPTAWAYYRLGINFEKLSAYDEALTNYFNAIHEDPMYASAWCSISRIYSSTGNIEKALEYAEKSVDIEFDNIEFNMLLANLYMKLSRFEEAENVYENLISLEVNEAQVWIEYSVLLKFLKQEEDALDILVRSLTYFPENVEVLYRLSGLMFNQGRELEGIDVLRDAMNIDYEKLEVLKSSFPIVYESELVQDLIFAHKHHGKFL